MGFYWIKTSRFIKFVFHRYLWSMPPGNKTVYLTFDDGPTPGVTTFVLDILKEQQVCATFFVIGKNVESNPALFRRIIAEGHQIGNHTYSHLNGWQVHLSTYIDDVEKCDEQITHTAGHPIQHMLFRPPYGKITGKQAKQLLSKKYKIVMWDILTADFDQGISKEKCFRNATSQVKDGSIIIFHDSVKAAENMQYALPKAIALLKERGYNFGMIR